MSGEYYGIPTDDEKKELLKEAQALLASIQRFDYMSPYSYQNLAQNDRAVDLLRTIARSLTHIDRTYFSGP